MVIKFEKWQGLGNDFIILKNEPATTELAIKLCNRNFGIGADGIFSAKKSEIADIGWDFFNSDGSMAQMCGNGIRCFAKFINNNNIVNNNKFSVETKAGIIKPEILENGDVVVDMGKPILDVDKIPVIADNFNKVLVQDFSAVAVSMGNPHCVIFCEENSEIMAKSYGNSIECDKIFPQKTNVEFVNIISNNLIRVNVWERGCGITLACGTGACACVVAGVHKNLISSKTDVILPGGKLNIFYDKENSGHVSMQGPAKKVFEGEFYD